jgi:hypothetical protein
MGSSFAMAKFVITLYVTIIRFDFFHLKLVSTLSVFLFVIATAVVMPVDNLSVIIRND